MSQASLNRAHFGSPAVAAHLTEAVPRPARSDEPFAEALTRLLGERGMSVRTLAGRTGVSTESLRAHAAGERSAPPHGLIEAVAAALRVPPEHFFEYRRRCLLATLAHRPARLDALFLESLSEAERARRPRASFSGEALGAAVRRLLAAAGTTQRALADELGMPDSEVSRFLTGRRRASPALLETFAVELRVPPEHFLEYRLAVVAEWLEETPERVDELWETEPDVPELEPHRAWLLRPLRHPLTAPQSELVRGLVEIAAVEGPVLLSRAGSIYLRAAAARFDTPVLRSALRRAAAAAVRSGLLAAEEEPGGERVLRLPGTAGTRRRTRGDRDLLEIPLGEIQSLAGLLLELRPARRADELGRVLLELYELDDPTEQEANHIERCAGGRR